MGAPCYESYTHPSSCDGLIVATPCICRAVPDIVARGLEPDLSNFNYTMNGQQVTDLITAQLNQSDFAFTGVSVRKKWHHYECHNYFITFTVLACREM